MTTPAAPPDNPRPSSFLMRWLRRILWAGAIAAALALAFAYLWPATRRFESYELRAISFLAFAIRTLIFHAAIGFTLLALCALALRARRLASLAALTSVVILGPVALSLVANPNPPADTPVLTILSANVLRGRADPASIAHQARQNNADIILIQEATPDFARALRAELIGDYPFIEEASRTGAFGQLTLSRLPFVAPAEQYPQGELAQMFEPRAIINPADPQIRTCIEFNHQEIIIQNIHLTSPGGVEAVAQQLEQARWLAEWGRSEPAPAIMMGDFNTAPTSAHAAMLRSAGWRDAFASVGRGRGATWPAIGPLSILPGVRIDHAYSRNGLTPIEFRVLEAHNSDHRPVLARFIIK
ncbi:MAG: endonuclease/exonuclease/phosphatase family protein [Phycisphaeraceae bacterium]|nr:endonuclease/exonuclease/phosphatase family protein [Phycisphaerales bacterium]MCB9841878.1 endonuclease/exonuclease/phosphatase family protein [Phycisphaeraceae bacterium]